VTDQEFRKLLDRQVFLLDAVRAQGVIAALRYKGEMERGARRVIEECYRRLEAAPPAGKGAGNDRVTPPGNDPNSADIPPDPWR